MRGRAEAMKIWNGQVHLSRDLQGPNLFGSCSGVLVKLDLAPELGLWLRQRPKEKEVVAWRQACAAVHGDSSDLSTSTRACSELSWVHDFLALSDALRQPYCIEQDPAVLRDLSLQHMVVFVPCDDVEMGLRATAVAAEMLFELLGTSVDGVGLELSAERLDQWRIRWHQKTRQWHHWADASALNVNARLVGREAVQQGIPFYRIPGSKSLLQLGQGSRQRRLNGALIDSVSCVGFHLSQDKWQTSALFATHGLPTAQPRVVSSLGQALAEAQRIGWPVVVKPRSTNKGVGITVNVQDETMLRHAFALAEKFRTGVLLERHVPGADHRLLVVGGRFTAAARRMPAQIVGDGQRTVAALVDALNLARFHREAHGVYLPLVTVELDAEALRWLKAAGFSPHDIPPPGVVLALRGNANLSTGGFSQDVTPVAHPDNCMLAERAARLVGLSMAGVDLQMPDISRSWREVGGAILEINAGPGLLPHAPATSHHNVPKAILEHLFPKGGTGRVLTAGVTGSLGKTTTCRMLERILERVGHTVALTGSQGAFVGGQQLRQGDLAGGRAALSMLQDPSVTALVAELARGGLIKRGVGLDALDVGAVLNVQDNHLGLDGVHTREQLADVKALVVRNVKRLAVLNADDPLCLQMAAGLPTERVCLVGETLTPPLKSHLFQGGRVAVVRTSAEGPLLSLQHGANTLGEIPMADIPATWGGRFRPAMVNALFAAALAHGLAVPFQRIEQGLTQFASDVKDNPGRMNRVSGVPFELWLSWADGASALREIRNFVGRDESAGWRSVVFYAVGNRPDGFIRDAAQALAGAFDRYFCTEMEEDRRGRPSGEVAALLGAALRESGEPASSIVVEPSTAVAVQRAIRQTPPGGTLVISSYRTHEAMEAIRAVWPQAA